MTRRHLDIARQLLRLPTAPFCEQAVSAWVKKFIARRPALRWSEDRWGNLLIKHGRPGRGRSLVFAAHMDHPGFRALGMASTRRIRARWMGGVPERLFPGAKVRFFSGGGWVKGILSSVEPHAEGQGHRFVRIAVNSPVEPGAAGLWDFPDPKVAGARLYARGCDDVAGVASLMALLDEACRPFDVAHGPEPVEGHGRTGRRKASRPFSVFLTRAEEGGFLGAIGACRSRTLPSQSVSVAIETSKELPSARQGDGPIVRVGDRVGIFTPAVTAFLVQAAQRLAARRNGFRYQRKLMDGGTCESSVYVEYGYAAGGLCLALGNYHNVQPSGKSLGPEYIDLNDFEGLVALYLAAVDDFPRYGKAGSLFRNFCERRFRRYQGFFQSPPHSRR